MPKRTGWFALTLVLLCSPWAHAQSVQEFPLSLADGDQWGAHLCADGAGGAWVMWHDAPAYTPGIVRLLLLEPGGDRDSRWPEGGLALNDTSASGRGHMLLADGSGGVYVAMVRSPHATGRNEVRLLHARADGTLDPAWGARGVLVYDGTPQEWNLEVGMGTD
ncbi:MAG: hypothetical protein ABL977_11585, partial [Candidatus Eisenbacteria bacterium]